MKEELERALQTVAELRKELNNLTLESFEPHLSYEKLERWKERAVKHLNLKISSKEGSRLKESSMGAYGMNPQANFRNEVNLYDGVLIALESDLKNHPEDVLDIKPDAVVLPATPTGTIRVGRKVFLGHGHSKLWARVDKFLRQEQGLDVIGFEDESRAGESIVPILENFLNESGFAVLVMTAEDRTAEGSDRARQNVVHEIGLFQGRLGFRNVIVLEQKGIEPLSNLAGLQVIRFIDQDVEQTFYELSRALKKEGLLK